MLFYSIELLLVHITCLHIFFVYIYLHLLAQDARLCHGRGKDHRILWTIVNATGRLRLHGFGGLRCACRREASRSPPPPKYPSLHLAAVQDSQHENHPSSPTDPQDQERRTPNRSLGSIQLPGISTISPTHHPQKADGNGPELSVLKRPSMFTATASMHNTETYSFQVIISEIFQSGRSLRFTYQLTWSNHVII